MNICDCVKHMKFIIKVSKYTFIMHLTKLNFENIVIK